MRKYCRFGRGCIPSPSCLLPAGSVSIGGMLPGLPVVAYHESRNFVQHRLTFVSRTLPGVIVFLGTEKEWSQGEKSLAPVSMTVFRSG